MKYFTPKLYQRFNNEDMSKGSCDEWDVRLKQYWDRIAVIKSKVPESVQKMMEISLHDAKIIECNINESNVVITVRTYDNKKYLTLNYTGMAYVEKHKGHPFFEEEKPDWLYDEFDLVFGELEHRIMWSDGRVLKILFSELEVSDFNP